LTYNANGVVQKVSDGARDWIYTYVVSTTNIGYSLNAVTLPDGSKWQYDLMAMARFKLHPGTSEPDTCNYMPGLATGTVSGTVTHPSGAVGTFVVAGVRHGRSYVTQRCMGDGIDPPYPKHAMYPKVFDTSSIVSRQISGPGLSGTQTWTYSYGSPNSSWSDCTGTCPTTKTVLVRQPEGRYQLMVFGNRFRTDEGRIYSIESGKVVAGSPETLVPLKTEQFTFQTTSAGQPFPANVGLINFPRGDWMAALLNPQKTHAQSQDSVTYTNTTNTFDRFANPVSVTRSSAGGAGGSFSRSETTAYHHDFDKWVLGQVASVTDGATGKVMSQTTYHATLALPLTTSRFGIVQQTMSYNANGTLASVKDGLNHMITLSNWYRGVPRTINYPTGVSESAVVNPMGTLASTTDELGYTHSYGYDPMGRLSGITYPTADSTVWTGTTRSFAQVASIEYGLAAGHWKQLVKTGNGWATTFYDAQWRLVLVLTEDAGNSKSFVVHRYDTAGREVFVSYPVATLVSVNDSLTGITTSYDALSRVTQTQQSSELGALTTTTEYLAGFQTRVTNPRGYKTTTSYQLFDSPSTDAPVTIISGVGLPQQQTTTIVREGFGKPLSITRSGTGG
ncbi:MAG: RHS repeat domain-containing protein, partial [Arenimonas sp.]